MTEIPVQIPKVGVAIDEATPFEWLVAHGGAVTEGDPLFLIETDKVETEVPSPATGTVYWEVELNQVYSVGVRVGRIESDD